MCRLQEVCTSKNSDRFFSRHYIYKTRIPKSIDAGSSGSSGIAIADYRKNSKIAEAYRNFADEFMMLCEQ